MSRPLFGLLFKSVGGAWRHKTLTISLLSLLIISTIFFVTTLRKAGGPIQADTTSSPIPSMAWLEHTLGPSLQPGGRHSPTKCRAKHKVVIIVPHRDRHMHLKLFLQHMHPFLQRQNIEYTMVVAEQAPGSRFNRALLMNVGFVEMSRRFNFTCYIFHDVDLLPLDDRIFYACMDMPLHLSMVVDTLGESLMYSTLFGGAVALTPSMVRQVNGFSNLYFGWGGEDDDMSYRIRSQGMSIQRYGKEVARYTMMRHAKEDSTQWNTFRKLEAGRGRFLEEGLNTLEYKVLEFTRLPLYTRILVGVNEYAILAKFGFEENLTTESSNSN